MSLARSRILGRFLAGLSLVACSSAVVAPAPTGSAGTPEPRLPSEGHWSCLSTALRTTATPEMLRVTQSIVPVRVPTPSAPLESLTVHVREVTSRADVADVEVDACGATDPLCLRGTRAHADRTGRATLGFLGGVSSFDGFLRISGAGTVDNYVFFRGRAPATSAGELDVLVYTPISLGILAGIGGRPFDPQLGLVRVDARDCSNSASPGIGVTLAAEGPVHSAEYFVRDGAALSGVAGGTDGTGIAFVAGVPTGPVTVTANAAGWPSGHATGFAFAGAVSWLVVHPDNAHPQGAGMAQTSCCASASLTACCDDLHEGDLVMYDAAGNGVSPVGCWVGGGEGATCTVGSRCDMKIDGQAYEGSCSAP